jgi:hypothetical protein
MANSEPLVLYGIVLIIVVSAFLVIPFLRGRTDLLTGWNTLLLGLIMFTGLGSIEVHYVAEMPYPQLGWFQPMASEVEWYMMATAAFVATLLAAYYLNGPARRFAQRRLQKWPEVNLPVTLFVLAYCLGIITLSVIASRITFLGPAFFKLGHKSAVFACVFSFALWYRNRINISWLLLFLGVLSTAVIYSMLVSPGRRLLLSVFLGPVLYVYWVQIRHWKPTKIVIALGIAGFLLLSLTTAYNRFRWYNLATQERRSVKGVIDQLKDMATHRDIYTSFLKNRLDYFAQSNAHFSLLTQRYVAQRATTPVPLNTLRFLASYAIPRKIWPDKPQVIGLTVTRDVAHIPGTNWGLGIAGQGAYEGGILALMLYAVLLAAGIQIFDQPMRMQPGNPFLVGIHAAALPHIVAIPRGDMGIMVAEAGECILFAVLLGFVCRSIFGTQWRPWPGAAADARWQSSYPSAYRVARPSQHD